ncbi:ATP-grasp domain-containing protein [Streptomyces sp. NPDC045456]|uniref:ATP-grasp domain-containing protein n=1 Tax=Streptomyces sp. NPDC045456 TaxID=3155254 RepID=UPI0033ED443C
MSSIVVLNPVKFGLHYKRAVQARGYRLISLYSFSKELLEERWPCHADGDDVSLYSRDLGGMLKELEPYRDDIRAVLSGSDASVDFADRLAHTLHLPGNGVELAYARNHKDAMRRVAGQAGLRIPRYRSVTSIADIPAAAHEVGFPAIVKHTYGGGSHGAVLLADDAALAGLGRLVKFDHFRDPVRKWLVEQYIRGREIAVNTMSYDGQHQIIDMWFYSQPDDSDYDFPYWNNVQINREDPDWDRVAAFTHEVLDVFGVRIGPGHTEVKCNADGVYLIEVAARLAGGPVTDMWLAHSDFNPYYADIDCRTGRRPEALGQHITFDAVFGAIAVRNEGAPGVLREIKGLDAFSTGPGVEKVLVAYAPGDWVPTTDSTTNIPLGAWVSGDTAAQVRERMHRLRDLVQLDIDREADGPSDA